MTPVGAALAALLAAAPDVPVGAPAAEPPATEAPSTDPPAALTAPRDVEPPPPRSPSPTLPQASGARAARRSEWNVLAGWGVLRLDGIPASGGQGRIAYAIPTPFTFGMQIASELFIGETDPGLAIRSGSLGFEIWSNPASVARAGVGVDLGWVGYRRATTSDWESTLTLGARVGAEVRLVRWQGGALVAGAHAAAHLGSWISGDLSAGVRFGGAKAP